MRIYDPENKAKLKKITLYLTPEEVQELADSLENLVNTKNSHEHIPDREFNREITVCVYEKENLQNLDDQSRRLIEEE